jgi:hypothetical protein
VSDRNGVRCAYRAGFASLDWRVQQPLLLVAIAFELCFTADLLWAPPLRELFGTEPPPLRDLVLVLPFQLIVWGADELWRWWARQRNTRSTQG